jgi:hypothetical protein
MFLNFKDKGLMILPYDLKCIMDAWQVACLKFDIHDDTHSTHNDPIIR